MFAEAEKFAVGAIAFQTLEVQAGFKAGCRRKFPMLGNTGSGMGIHPGSIELDVAKKCGLARLHQFEDAV